MITQKKIDEFEEFRGSYDGFELKRLSHGTNINTEDDWFVIEGLLQDIQLVDRKLAAKSFKQSLEQRLLEACDSKETIHKLKVMAAQHR